MTAPIVGWESSFVVALVNRDGEIVKTLSATFASREHAEKVWRWKRRGRPGVEVVQLLTVARVLT